MAEETIQNKDTVVETAEMTEERAEFRRRRVKRIKRLLIFLLIFFLLIPNLVCAFLLYQLYKTNKNIDSLKEEIKLSQEAIEKQTAKAAAAKIVENDNEEELQRVKELELSNLTDEEKYPDKQLVYLTFDDGPSKYTDEILDILKEHNAKATFFVLATEGYDDQYNRIVAEGHTLGIHSFSHRYNTIYSSLEAFEADVSSVSDYVEEKTGTKPKFYRFPGGSSNSVSRTPIQDMIHYLSDNGYVYYDWNVSSEDAQRIMLPSGNVARNVINGVGSKKTAVVLMHDAAGKRSTVEALPIILETLQEKGNVEFLPITDGTKQIYHVKEKEVEVQ